MLVLYSAVITIALCYVAKILLPEISKPFLSKITPEPDTSGPDQGPDNRAAKLETLLAEKSKSIELLQTELKIFHVQINNFDKLRTLLEEEITRLREQNRIFRSELGMPTVAPKENSLT